jgi:hypothetical protein
MRQTMEAHTPPSAAPAPTCTMASSGSAANDSVAFAPDMVAATCRDGVKRWVGVRGRQRSGNEAAEARLAHLGAQERRQDEVERELAEHHRRLGRQPLCGRHPDRRIPLT